MILYILMYDVLTNYNKCHETCCYDGLTRKTKLLWEIDFQVKLLLIFKWRSYIIGSWALNCIQYRTRIMNCTQTRHQFQPQVCLAFFVYFFIFLCYSLTQYAIKKKIFFQEHFLKFVSFRGKWGLSSIIISLITATDYPLTFPLVNMSWKKRQKWSPAGDKASGSGFGGIPGDAAALSLSRH